jgi:hypothetical protein
MIVPMRDFIQSGLRDGGSFHYFSCIPKPKIYRVMMAVHRHVHWSLYSGDLDEVDVQQEEKENERHFKVSSVHHISAGCTR